MEMDTSAGLAHGRRFWILALACLACDDGRSGQWGVCARDADCLDGLVCEMALCVPATSPCEPGCRDDEACVWGQCYPKNCPERSCAGIDEVCEGRACIQAACIGRDCPEGQRCAGGRCYPIHCEDGLCPGYGELCLDGACIQSACVGVECAEGERCAGGRCRPDNCGWSCGDGEVCLGGRCVDALCAGVTCSQGFVCRLGWCASDTCTNSVRDGRETDTDCGGPDCPACLRGQACDLARDCSSGFCSAGHCLLCGLTQGPLQPAATVSVAITDSPSSDDWHIYPDGSATDVAEAVSADDRAYAIANVSPGSDSRALRAGEFGFDLPMGAIVAGIECRLLRATSGTVTNRDLTVQLLRAGEPVGDNRADLESVWPDASVGFAQKTYGGPEDCWGAVWTEGVEDLGVQIATHNHWNEDPSTAYIDAVDLLVHYCVP
ncbi:MAG: hypothetical protein JXR96_22585 [Deltaproteobacteria bacterium]|nr:hypothetical protein [Deltaproteobacteria bacterium]